VALAEEVKGKPFSIQCDGSEQSRHRRTVIALSYWDNEVRARPAHQHSRRARLPHQHSRHVLVSRISAAAALVRRARPSRSPVSPHRPAHASNTQKRTACYRLLAMATQARTGAADTLAALKDALANIAADAKGLTAVVFDGCSTNWVCSAVRAAEAQTPRHHTDLVPADADDRSRTAHSHLAALLHDTTKTHRARSQGS